MDLELNGKTALVTGASSGLGFAAAQVLAEEGATLAINSRSEKNLRIAAEKIEVAAGSRPLTVAGDLAASETADRIVAQVSARLGTVDILVSNAGGPPAGTFLQHDKRIWRQAADLTLHSAIDLARAVIPAMQQKKWGRIVFITSVAVKQPVDNLIISNTLRAGLTGFAKSISNELASDGITINTVCPGYTMTERLKYLAQYLADQSGGTVEDVYRGWASEVPAGRLGRPEELAYLISFLASDRAAYITGTAIPVDGGHIKGLL
ncbi:MAG: SDR family oxidoreductase [Candidatus Zixiibacteriota bacterium]|nr:MAG: SDR family oxidoreductase [candidate division Zixibacteria bacterium]